MRRFGTIFPFVEQGCSNLKMGRLVANHDFVKALLKHGTFDEYLFSNPSGANLEIFEKVLSSWSLSPAQRSRVRLISYASLPFILQREQFHVFHLGGWGYFMPGLHYLRNQHASNPWPITATIHSLSGRIVIDHAVRLSRAGMSPYDSLICTSRDGREAMVKLLEGAAGIAGSTFQGRLDLLPLGIDDDFLSNGGDRRRARQQMEIPLEAVVLLVLGRITPSQKMDLAPLLQTLAQQILPSSQGPVCLVIAGGADSLEFHLIRKLIDQYQLNSHTRVRANFRSEIKADLLASADIFISLADNTQETFGLSLLEAQALGIPTIASRFDGYKDLVRDGIDGFLIDSYRCDADPLADLFDLMDPNLAQLFQAQSVAIDMNQLAERVLTLIHDAQARQTMGEIARRKITRDFLYSKIIRRYEHCWDELAHQAEAEGLSPPRQNPFNLSQAPIFRHYASRTLQPEDKVIAHKLGAIPQPYNEVRILVDDPVVQSLLSHASASISIAELMERAHLSVTHGWFAIMWLIKYNLLRVVTPSEFPLDK